MLTSDVAVHYTVRYIDQGTVHTHSSGDGAEKGLAQAACQAWVHGERKDQTRDENAKRTSLRQSPCFSGAKSQRRSMSIVDYSCHHHIRVVLGFSTPLFG